MSKKKIRSNKNLNINNEIESDSESESNKKNNVKIINRYILESESESESDESKINKEIKLDNKKDNVLKVSEKNKKIQQEKGKEKVKNKYNFELDKKSKTKTLEQKTVANSTNSIITLYSENIEVTINNKILINNSDISINSGTKYFVLGQNGIGKTTLLKQIYIQLQNKLDVLMIDQDIEIKSNEMINEFILNADPIIYEAKKKMDELEKKEELTEEESDEYNKLSEILYQKEWFKYEAESKRILYGLGFTNPEIPVNILSGGKRMILAIGKALLRKPDILMLDEPTNHLDLDVVIWLTNYLESYKKTLIVITHQIGLVNSVADIIWYVGNPELKGNKIYTIRGNYNKLLKFLEQSEKETLKNYDKSLKKIEELRKKSTPKKIVDEFIKKEGILRPSKPYIVNITFDNVK